MELRRRVVGVVLAVVALLGLPAGGAAQSVDRGVGDVGAGGAFTCDFALGPTAFKGNIAAVIERDRMNMSAQPGMLHKHIPFRPDPLAVADGGVAFSGGRYLFDTAEHAAAYETFVKRLFTLDGVQFLKRDYFKNPTCHAWQVVAAHEFASIEHQLVFRTEWLNAGSVEQLAGLRARWPALRAEAQRRGYSAVWLLQRPDAAQAAVVYFTDRMTPDAVGLDVAGLLALEAAPPLGKVVAGHGWTRSFDRTEWAMTIWFPFATGDHGRPAVWPYSALPSPERPGPDGLCEPSRGENHRNDPKECLPHCGDGIIQRNEGETTRTCPSDVPWTDPP